ncbi:hypothetical protein O6H91_10G099700 [Diphasiastrum complanatum]|uniref:Uncharacterized protein n=2 Tax=Diphasiastrum complanatum TaxID=34168 RepID=A0ACC2CJT7_DIPCM|nr:hypothetical protein O6H91_10G099700 [Diphasiastrum complanatum]KAJ7542291.1 hypothetical protein O6H91_10G099700 [Diphasiastrum complanatum]
MASSARSKAGGIPRRGEEGGGLLEELDALSQALYKNAPMQSSRKATSLEPRSGRPPPARDRRTSDVIAKPSQQLPSVPSSAVKPPLSHARHSLSGFRSSASSADEGNGNKGISERHRHSHSQAGESHFPEWFEDNMSFGQKLESPLEKKSIWNWRPLRALARIGQQRFNCAFSALVHGIGGLPSRMNGIRLIVHFKHKDSSVQTLPSRVFGGAVEFEETLYHRCAVFGSRKISQAIKYMPKSFTLTVVALDIDELELGKYRLDLSRLLPASIDEKSDEDNANALTARFKLSGKGKGGSLLITFGYEISVSEKESRQQLGNTSARFGNSPARRALHSFNSLPNSPHGRIRRRSSGVPLSSTASSEPNTELADFLGMDHFSLDETYNQEDMGCMADTESKLGVVSEAEPGWNPFADLQPQQEEFSKIDSLLAPTTPGQSSEYSENMKINWIQPHIDLEDESSVDDTESVLDDHGMERSLFSREVQTTTVRKSDGADEVESEPNNAGTAEALFEGNWQPKEDSDVLTASKKELQQDSHTGDSSYIELGESDLTRGQHISDLKNVQDEAHEEGREDNAHLTNNGSLGLHFSVNGTGYDAVKPIYSLDSTKDGDIKTLGGAQKPSKEPGWELHPASRLLEVQEKTQTPEIDDEADLVASEFLHMLEGVRGSALSSSDSESNSPRAMLLKQFEQEALLGSSVGLNLNLPKDSDLHKAPNDKTLQLQEKGWQQDYAASSTKENNELAAIMDAAESELQKAAQTMLSKARAKMLEDAETEALMQEWGLHEKVFESSPPNDTNHFAFGNPSEELMEAPSLAHGLGSVVPTRDGGELRSMRSTHLQSGYSGGHLAMHVSKPVVVPVEMGSSTLDILKRMAAAGVENMAMQAMLSMPLEDIAGKSVHQIAFEGQTAVELIGHRYAPLGPGQEGSELGVDYISSSMKGGFLSDSHQLKNKTLSSGSRNLERHRKVCDVNSEAIVSLEDLAPIAMEKIEALALEGLKIQSDMAEEDAPYSVDAMSWNEADAIGSRKQTNDGFNLLAGFAASQLLEGSNLQQEEAGGESFMSSAISLEEWMRLDAGLYDDAETNENTLATLAAHNTNHNSLVGGTSKQRLVQNKGPRPCVGGGGGFMGDTLTLAMLVQLRDPLQNFEPVGAPMMALVQAERVLVPPRPKLWRRVSVMGNGEDDEDQNKTEQQQQFKIIGVHVSGLKPSEDIKEDKKKLWGSQKQQQSGSRWLLANGMAKLAKPALLKSKPVPFTPKAKQSESLWSISSHIQGNGKKWQQSSARNSLVRNPDVTFCKSKR